MAELFLELRVGMTTLTTPRENELSGRLSTQGNPARAATLTAFSRWSTTVLGIGMSCRLSSSAR